MYDSSVGEGLCRSVPRSLCAMAARTTTALSHLQMARPMYAVPNEFGLRALRHLNRIHTRSEQTCALFAT